MQSLSSFIPTWSFVPRSPQEVTHEFSSHTATRGQPCNDGDIRLILAATYWKVTCSVPQTNIMGSIPRKMQYCNIVKDKTVCIKCTVGQAESITDRQHMAFTQLTV